MNDHGKKIQERSEVDMTSSDSRNIMGSSKVLLLLRCYLHYLHYEPATMNKYLAFVGVDV